MAKGLWKYVDGSATLADDASAKETAKYRSESQKAFSIIAMSVTTAKLYRITSCEEPKMAWDAQHFERETLANTLFLKVMKESTSIDVHLKEIEELTDKLGSIGAPISNGDQVVFLLETCLHHSPPL